MGCCFVTEPLTLTVQRCRKNSLIKIDVAIQLYSDRDLMACVRCFILVGCLYDIESIKAPFAIALRWTINLKWLWSFIPWCTRMLQSLYLHFFRSSLATSSEQFSRHAVQMQMNSWRYRLASYDRLPGTMSRMLKPSIRPTLHRLLERLVLARLGYPWKICLYLYKLNGNNFMWSAQALFSDIENTLVMCIVASTGRPHDHRQFAMIECHYRNLDSRPTVDRSNSVNSTTKHIKNKRAEQQMFSLTVRRIARVVSTDRR